MTDSLTLTNANGDTLTFKEGNTSAKFVDHPLPTLIVSVHLAGKDATPLRPIEWHEPSYLSRSSVFDPIDEATPEQPKPPTNPLPLLDQLYTFLLHGQPGESKQMMLGSQLFPDVTRDFQSAFEDSLDYMFDSYPGIVLTITDEGLRLDWENPIKASANKQTASFFLSNKEQLLFIQLWKEILCRYLYREDEILLAKLHQISAQRYAIAEVRDKHGLS